MAHCMKLRHEFQTPTGSKATFQSIWNLSHGVGTPSRERNQPTDVELVQRLLMLLDHGDLNVLSSSTWSRIKPTGHLDDATRAAIEEVDFSQDLKHRHGWRISPARYGLVLYRQKDGKPTERTEYFIVLLQRWIAQQGHGEALNALPAGCSPALRHELLLGRASS
jgi:hypothetical protein